ncbi:MAG: PEP-CTERM sorting domain-containing protein [Pseudomonadota bacterium]
MFKKSLILLSLLAASPNIWADMTYTNRAAWEAAVPGAILDEPEFVGCSAQSCTYYFNQDFTDTKVLGQVDSILQFNSITGIGIQHGNFSAIGFNVGTQGVNVGGKLAFGMGDAAQQYVVPSSFTGGFFGIVINGITQLNILRIIPISSTPVTYTLSNIQTSVSPTPEPETYAMLLLGLGSIGFLRRKARTKK